MRSMNAFLVGTTVLALASVLAIGCTSDDDEPGTGLGGSTHSGGNGGDTGETGGRATGGRATGGTQTQGGGAGVEAGGVEAGGAATGGVEAGGVEETGGVEAGGVEETGGVEAGGVEETGGVEAGGVEAGGATHGDGGAAACLGGDDVGALDSAYDTCSEWSVDVFGTQMCETGDPDVNGPLGDDLCWYYEAAGRSDVFDALLECFADFGFSRADCTNAHENYMWDCVASVGAQACPTEDGTALCEAVADDCTDVSVADCEGEVNLVIASERTIISECWTDLTNNQRTGNNCAAHFEDCVSGG